MSTPRCTASNEIDDLVRRYNKQNDSTIDPALNDIIYLVVRLYDDVAKDSRASGWSARTREVRRRLYNKLHMTGLVQQDSADQQEKD